MRGVLVRLAAGAAVGVAIATNCDPPDAAQGLMLFVLPPLAGVLIGLSAWRSFSAGAPGRYSATVAATFLVAIASWIGVAVIWVGRCSA